MINNMALNKMSSSCRTYLIADTLCDANPINTLITTEFLNSLDVGGGIPPHALRLCKDAPVMLLCNLDANAMVQGSYASNYTTRSLRHTSSMGLMPEIEFFDQGLTLL